MGSAVARALLPDISLLARAPARESAALQMLACWAGRFTPHVSLADDTVLLEVGRCLRLFGGLRQLVMMVSEAARPLEFTLALAAAPTPQAAQWLAQEGRLVFCTRPSRLAASLDALPVRVLPRKAAESLQRFGCATLGEARRLPAAPLARRIGVSAVQALARAYGEAPDLRADYAFPEHFSLSLSLPALVEQAAALLFAARRLTAALAGWLAARQMGVRVTTLYLHHESGETPLALRFAEQTADGERFDRVLRERLERLELVAPVDVLRLEATEVAPLAGRSAALFNDGAQVSDGMGALLERLSARLGEAVVFQLAVRHEHRPECATQHATPQTTLRASSALSAPPSAMADAMWPPRPLWLLDAPEALHEVDGRPCRHGPLDLLAGPERIEAGWWESDECGDKRDDRLGEVRGESLGQNLGGCLGEGLGTNVGAGLGDIWRDYFIARSRDDRWLWIFRECRIPGGWFLHGYFS